MEIKISGSDGDAVKAMARRIISQNPTFSPDWAFGSDGKVYVVTISERSEMELRQVDKSEKGGQRA